MGQEVESPLLSARKWECCAELSTTKTVLAGDHDEPPLLVPNKGTISHFPPQKTTHRAPRPKDHDQRHHVKVGYSLEHEEVDGRARPPLQNLCESWKAVFAATGPLVMLSVDIHGERM
jgi:hypothetical protein